MGPSTLTALYLTALALPTSAFPLLAQRQTQPDFSKWAAPGPGDVRSPCPGINTLANHYLLPHDGKNINVSDIVAAIKTGYNFGPDFGNAVGNFALSAQMANRAAGTFDLDDVNEHNFPIEQDASLSRQDAYFGNPQPFIASILAQSLSAYSSSQKTLDVASHAKAHVIRVNDSKARNPTFLYGARQYVGAYIRDATGIAAMGGFGKPLAWYSYWITNERLPTSMGWTVPTTESTLPTLAAMGAQLATSAGSADLAPNGVRITVDTIKDVYELKDPITRLLASPSDPNP